MGTARAPLGKRLTLQRKISVTWALLNDVIGLVYETTATTSAMTLLTASVNARARAAASMRDRTVMIEHSPHKIDGNAGDIHGGAALKVRLHIDQRARGTGT